MLSSVRSLWSMPCQTVKCTILSATSRRPQLSRRCTRKPEAEVGALSDVFSKHGLKPYQVDRITRELERLTDQSRNTSAWVEERIQLLSSTFGPDVPVAEAVYNGGVDLLQQDMANFPAQLVALKEALHGEEVLSVVCKEPRLLWMADVQDKIPKVIKKLVQIYPYKSPNKKQNVIKLVQEYPELLVRLQYYCDDPKIKKVQDLPVDLQNRILRSYC